MAANDLTAKLALAYPYHQICKRTRQCAAWVLTIWIPSSLLCFTSSLMVSSIDENTSFCPDVKWTVLMQTCRMWKDTFIQSPAFGQGRFLAVDEVSAKLPLSSSLEQTLFILDLMLHLWIINHKMALPSYCKADIRGHVEGSGRPHTAGCQVTVLTTAPLGRPIQSHSRTNHCTILSRPPSQFKPAEGLDRVYIHMMRLWELADLLDAQFKANN